MQRSERGHRTAGLIQGAWVGGAGSGGAAMATGNKDSGEGDWPIFNIGVRDLWWPAKWKRKKKSPYNQTISERTR